MTKQADSTADPDETRERVRAALERELAQVRSPAEAEAIVRQLDALANGATEAQAGAAAAQAPAAAEIEAAAWTAAAPAAVPATEPAAVIAQAAAAAVAPTAEAPTVIAAAQEAVGTRAPVSGAPSPPPPPGVRRGRRLLRDAVLRQMGPLSRLDARLYLAVNRLPHPPAADRVANFVTVVTVSGWVWMGLVGVAALFRVRGSRRALSELIPVVACATWLVEFPVKALFRRRRPFVDVVRALVVGKEPGSSSFPSGHTAASFATALVLSAHWRRLTPLFYLLATGVGFSRVYVGAHYPGDVTSGALLGTAFAEAFRLLVHLAYARLGRTSRRDAASPTSAWSRVTP